MSIVSRMRARCAGSSMRGKARAFAGLERDGLAQRVRDDEDVAEDDGGVEAEAADGLQRDFRRLRRVVAERQEIGRRGAQFAVLGQITAGLPHEPDGRAREGLSIENAHEPALRRSTLGYSRHLPTVCPDPHESRAAQPVWRRRATLSRFTSSCQTHRTA